MSGDHNMHQKDKSYLDFECPRCGHCCQALETEPFEYWNAVEGWVKIDEVREHFDSVGCGTIYKSAGEGRSPLYTAPPKKQWVGLTDEEVSYCRYAATFCDELDTAYMAELIEQALKERTHEKHPPPDKRQHSDTTRLRRDDATLPARCAESVDR